MPKHIFFKKFKCCLESCLCKSVAHTCLGRYWWGRWTAVQGSGSHKWGSKGINLLTFHELLKPYNLGLVQFDCLVYRIYYFISERFCIQRIKNIFMISCQTLMYFEYHEKIWPLRSLAFGEKSTGSASTQRGCCPVHCRLCRCLMPCSVDSVWWPGWVTWPHTGSGGKGERSPYFIHHHFHQPH